MEWVYEIIVEGKRRYVGRTNNMRRREAEHRRHFKLGTKKHLYDEMRKLKLEGEIVLNPIKSFKKKIDAKRWECLLILNDYFNGGELWQKCPRIGD